MSSIRVAIVGVGDCGDLTHPGRPVLPGRRPGGGGSWPDAREVRGLPRLRRRVRRRVRRRRQEGRLRPVRGHPGLGEQHHQDHRRAAARHHRAARPTLDGLGKYYRQTIDEADADPVDVVAALKEANADVLVPYLPVGSEEPTSSTPSAPSTPAWRSSTRCRCSSPPTPCGPEVPRRRRPHRRRRHQVAGRRDHHPPGAGQAVRGPRRGSWTAPTSSTSAATWTSRTCSNASAWSPRRSPRPSR